MTPIEFYWAITDYGKLEELKIEVNLKAIFESMRIQTAFHSNMNPYVKKKFKTPQELFKFEWDKVQVQTSKEMQDVLKNIAGVFGTKDIPLKRTKFKKKR